MDNVITKPNSVETLIQETYKAVFGPIEDFIKNGCRPLASIAKWDTKASISINELDKENIKNQGQVIQNNRDRSKFYLEAIKEASLNDEQLKLIKEECEAGHERDMETARLGQEAASRAREAHKEQTNLTWLVIAIAAIPTIAGALQGIMAAFSGNKDN